MRGVHPHEWTASWGHWGPYGSQEEHIHDCFVGNCKHFLVGPGRDCDGKLVTHQITRGVNRPRRAAI